MRDAITDLLDRFSRTRLLVLGEAVLDRYLCGTATRRCPEAPVPVVAVSHCVEAPGGAANVAANGAALGARVTYLAPMGDDTEATRLRAALAARGVGTEHLIAEPGRRTLLKERLVADGQVLARADSGSTAPPRPAEARALAERLAALLPTCDVVVVGDHGCGAVTPVMVALLGEWTGADPARLLAVKAKDLDRYRAARPTAVTLAYQQVVDRFGLRLLSGPTRVQQVMTEAERILAHAGADLVAVMCEADGVVLLTRGRLPHRIVTRPVPPAQMVGMGDTFLVTLALALAAGAEGPTAADLAAVAVHIVGGREGTAVCSAADLRAGLLGTAKVVQTPAALAARVATERAHGKRVVFTNGCFDLLHRGHVELLRRARALGDLLIVAVNSDASVRRLKGPTRPINGLADRLGVLAALDCVDLLVPFDDDTPAALIRVVRPDLYVKGGDYTRATLPEAAQVEALGGAVCILPLIDDHSTTALIERVRAPVERDEATLWRAT